MQMETSNQKLQRNCQALLANQTPSQRKAVADPTSLSNIIKRPSPCRLCDGHGKIYRNAVLPRIKNLDKVPYPARDLFFNKFPS